MYSYLYLLAYLSVKLADDIVINVVSYMTFFSPDWAIAVNSDTPTTEGAVIEGYNVTTQILRGQN